MPPSTSFYPCDLHNHQKSNILVSPVISSEYVQVLCAEMPPVVNHFLLATSWFLKRNPKPEIWISKFLPTSFPCLVPQQATSCYLPIAWFLDVQHCNNECYSIVKEDCNGNMSFENALRYALTHRIIAGYLQRASFCHLLQGSAVALPLPLLRNLNSLLKYLYLPIIYKLNSHSLK